MLSLRLVTLILLLSLGQGNAQEGQKPTARLLPQWLTGLIAVTVFLFLVLVAYVVNRFWERRSQDNMMSVIEIKSDGIEEVVSNGTHESYRTLDSVRSTEHEHAYENLWK
ncbi:PDZK1-interacting protein 1 [Bombina bombina]|uniref:PDZK1-interacting protein 1 n=1 Tax=Bombina bombina TaxID=8345 RepID=UPI00235B0213|nr:PDZK1-interacting protein 1 [Bombina bombina]